MFKKKARSVQEESKNEQEHKILSWFTLPQRLRPFLCQSTKISTNQDHKDQFTTIQTLAISKNTVLPTVINLLNPSASYKHNQNTVSVRNKPTEPFNKLNTIQNVLHSQNYNTLCNSQQLRFQYPKMLKSIQHRSTSILNRLQNY